MKEVRSRRPRGHVRSLYEVPGRGLHAATPVTIATRALRDGVLLADSEIREVA